MALSDAETDSPHLLAGEPSLDADFGQYLVCGQFGMRRVVGGAAESDPVGRVQVGVLVCPAGCDLCFIILIFSYASVMARLEKAPWP